MHVYRLCLQVRSDGTQIGAEIGDVRGGNPKSRHFNANSRHFSAILTPFQRHFNAIVTPFQPHFNAVSTPF